MQVLHLLLLGFLLGCSREAMTEHDLEENRTEQASEESMADHDLENDTVQLHPDFPVVEGRYQMTENWSVDLPSQFNRRIEDGSLVLWKPGFTIWTTVWGNDKSENPKERMDSLISDLSPDAFDLTTDSNSGLLRLSYRLREEADDDRQAAFYCFTFSDSGHVQMAIYFDASEDLEEAQLIWRNITESEDKG